MFFFRKSCCLWHGVQKYCKSGQVHLTIWRIPISRYIPKTADTHYRTYIALHCFTLLCSFDYHKISDKTDRPCYVCEHRYIGGWANIVATRKELTGFGCEENTEKIVTLFSKYFPLNRTSNDGHVLFYVLWNAALLMTTEVAGDLHCINNPLKTPLEVLFVSVLRGFVEVPNLRRFWSEWKPFRNVICPTVHLVSQWWWEQEAFAGKGK
jgi:hypothetical protein